MSMELFYIALSIIFLLSTLNTFLLIRRSENRRRSEKDTLFDEKIALLRKEIYILEKRSSIQEKQLANLASSIVSFEKVLTTLLTSQGGPFGGGFGSDDGTMH